MVSNIEVFVGLGINGFFTGLGVITANTFFEYYIKPRIKSFQRFHRKLRGGINGRK